MLLWIDTETGGIDPDKVSLLEWAGIITTDDTLREIDRLEMKVMPDDGIFHVTSTALSVNEINLVTHGDLALTYTYAGSKLHEMLSRCAGAHGERLTVAGWNVGFDISFTVKYLMSRAMWGRYTHYSTLDVSSVAKFLFPKVRGLHILAQEMLIPIDNAHHALADVETTIAVYRTLHSQVHYRYGEEIRPMYNDAFGDDRECICGHTYYRHFDTYEAMEPVGCKYCQCDVFKEQA